jgi:hypothetical protein
VSNAIVAGALLAVVLALAPAAGLAQDATPAAMDGMAPHPVHIHAGTCATLGDVVHPLSDLQHGDMMGTPMAGMEGMDGTPMADMDDVMGDVESMSTTTVEASLEDILAAEHAINAHESAENIDVYIVCGDISGEPTDGQLEIELMEDSDSGHTGRAMLMDNGDGTTTVTVWLMGADAMAMDDAAAEGTPVP